MTEGLGPDSGGHSLSVCTADHAVEANHHLQEVITELQGGENKTLVVGMGHGTCTCEGAAFEYVFNVEHELRAAGVRDKARLVYLTNEPELGDFGMGGMTFMQEGYETTSKIWTESLFRERGVEAVVGAHVHKVESGVIHFETLDGSFHELPFDFAMLLPPFGVSRSPRTPRTAPTFPSGYSPPTASCLSTATTPPTLRPVESLRLAQDLPIRRL